MEDFLRVLEIIIWPVTISRIVRVIFEFLNTLRDMAEAEEEEKKENG